MAKRKRARTRDTWPINPGAGLAPKSWSGWPEGKKFALILTHDVESATGIERVRILAIWKWLLASARLLILSRKLRTACPRKQWSTCSKMILKSVFMI